MERGSGMLANVQTWWPVILSFLACGAMLVTTHTTLEYVARDVAELRVDVRTLMNAPDDRHTSGDHKRFLHDEFAPLQERVRGIEMRVVRVEEGRRNVLGRP